MRMLSLPLLLALASPGALAAQAMIQPLPGTSDADLLAATMRRVAANPLDVDALLTAGEQSLRVDDLSGAASLFARAEKIDPRNGRVRAGMASILVRSERPGEALRYFAQAQAAGLDPRRFAADRGFAYDLVGDQARAQADYRTALAGGPANDETVRRYALSLGISGRGEEALRQLQPLLGRSDRAAWRARAFIMAMTGDQSGAERIAATMMPAGMAQGLRPFFERLPSLPAADRAFAVHFGEVRPTPERIADARLAPVLAPLPVEPRPVQVAAATTAARPESRGERRRREREERRAARDRVALAAASARAAPARTTPAAPLTLPSAAAVVTPPVQVAALASPRSVPVVTAATPVTPAVTVAPGFTGAVAAGPVAALPAVSEAVPTVRAIAETATIASPAGEAGLAPLVVAAAPPVVAPVATTVATPTPVPAAADAGAGVALAAVGSGGASASADPLPAPSAPRGARTPAADSVLARIVASLSIPAAELGVAAPPRAPAAAGTTTEGAARTAEALRTKAARDAVANAAAERLVRGRVRDTRRGADAAEPVELAATAQPGSRTARGRRGAKAGPDAAVTEDATPRTGRGRRDAGPEPVTTAADADAAIPRTGRGRRGAKPEPATAIADTADAPARRGGKTAAAARSEPGKLPTDRKAAADKKAAVDKAAEERRVARAHPSRIWVQVAGGAYEGDLPKAWAATRAKAPDLLGGRGAYAAKLRATNRVVTGPFKTDAEARAFVNKLAKSGVAAFPFTSDAGEAVTRLPSK